MSLLFFAIFTLLTSPKQGFVSGPTDLNITIIVERNPDNRELLIDITSENGVDSHSSFYLEGEMAPKVFVKSYKHLIKDYYTIRATVRTTSKSFSVQSFLEVV